MVCISNQQYNKMLMKSKIQTVYYVAKRLSSNQQAFLVEKAEMERFMEKCMLTAGAKTHHAQSLASCLIAADYRGHFSHGLNRLGRSECYVRFLILTCI